MYYYMCDMCGHLQTTKREKFYHISRINASRDFEKDVCPDCLKKMLEAVGYDYKGEIIS